MYSIYPRRRIKKTFVFFKKKEEKKPLLLGTNARMNA